MNSAWPEIPKDRQTCFLIGAVFVCLWLLARCGPSFPYVYPEGQEARLSGADSYFHLRHAEAVTQDFPHLQRHDNMTTFPHVERGINQGLYDVGVAALSKASAGLLSPTQILIWISPLLSGLAYLLLGLWLWHKVAPWCSILFYSGGLLYPGPLIQMASLGNGDHHAYEVFLATVLVLALSRALQTDASYGWTVLSALLLFTFLLSWAGAPLHLFFVGLSFFVVAFLNWEATERRPLMGKGVLFGLLTATLPYLVRVLAPSYIPWERACSVFIAGGLALGLGYPVLVGLAQRLPTRARPFVALGLLLSLPFVSQLHQSSAKAFELFFSARPSTISEHAQISFKLLFLWFGLQTVGLLLAPILAAKRGDLANAAVPLTYGWGLLLFWLHTKDFNYYASPAVAAAAAYVLYQLPWKKWTPILLLSLSLFPLFPTTQTPWLPNLRARGTVLYSKGLEQGAEWLQSFKKTQGQDQEYGLLAPWDLGNILAHTSKTPVGWSQTHSKTLAKFLYASDTDEVYQKLGKQKKPFRFVLIPSRNIQDKYGTEMMVAGIDPSTIFNIGPEVTWKEQTLALPVPNETYKNTLLFKLFEGLGSQAGHFRMVFESPQQMVKTVRIQDNLSNFSFVSLEVSEREAEGLKPILRSKNQVLETSRGLLINPSLIPDVRIFEMVPGALVVGQSKPHTRVGAILSVSAPYNELPQIITWKTYADSDGKFELRLPYPTDTTLYNVPGSIRVNGKYRLDIEGRLQELEITEDQVQSEARVPITFRN